MNPFNAAVGSLLYETRTKSGLTENEMAQKCKIPQEDYIDFELGNTALPLDAFINISIACDIDANKFINKFKNSLSGDENSQNADVTYCTEEELFTSDDGVKYTGYNVLIKCGNTVISRFYDVFLNKDAAYHFVDMCNRLHLDPLHVSDVIDDVIII